MKSNASMLRAGIPSPNRSAPEYGRPRPKKPSVKKLWNLFLRFYPAAKGMPRPVGIEATELLIDLYIKKHDRTIARGTPL